MKFKALTFIAILISFGAFAQKQKPAQTQKQNIQLVSQLDSLQYVLGAYLGQWMVKNDFQVQNTNLFLTGMEDELKQRPLAIPDSIIAPLIATYQQATQIEKNKLLEQQLFASLKGKTGVGVLPNGVNYIIRRQGEGVRPVATSKVLINAVGVLPDGTIFEDSYKKKQPITAEIGTLIPGLKEIIQLMPVGSVWRVFIPAELGYGAVGLNNIVPPHSALVYDIELLEIKE
jgi:FKBP-type peptidyl-prolyl cis-trans isomerase